jgi:hypothetical protein
MPGGMSLRSEGSSIQVLAQDEVIGGTPALEIISDDDGRALSEKIETAACAALSGIQDVIVENIHGPWPNSPGNGTDLPQPGCRVAGTELRAWFGDEAAPAVSVHPVRLR